jgi:hypothetical protein
MAEYSKLDPYQIQRITFDEESSAVKVKMIPIEMSMELSADDGDSILSLKQMQVIEALAGQVIDTSKASRMNVVSASPVACSMVINSQEISLGNLSGIHDVCSPAIKVAVACIVVLQS